MRLDKDKAKFLQYLNETSSFFNISQEYVEKDYWLCLLLKNILAKDSDYVFKGGTSLSKCYRLINRFSEDIDISYTVPYDDLDTEAKARKVKRIVKAINEVGVRISNPGKIRNDAYFNQFRCPYFSFYYNNVTVKEVVIELAAQTPSFPFNKMKMQSFVGEYLLSTKREQDVKQYELEPFEVNVQSIDRTLVDKTFALCDYYLDNKCDKHSRHLYDIHKIMTIQSLDKSLADLFKEVRKYRSKNKICVSAKKGNKLFSNMSELLNKDSYKKDYNNLTYQLLYDDVKYIDCINSLRKLEVFLKEYDI